MKIKFLSAVVFLVFQSSILFSQNVGINGTGAVPNASAMLDVDAANKGVLIPRVALTQTTSNSPIGASVTTSLLIYNTATINDVIPGYYYWNGTIWVRLALDGDYWKTNGNSLTTAPASGIGTAINNNFIGTKDAIDFAIATNGYERFRIKSDNNSQVRIGIGTAFTVNMNAGSTPSLFHLHDWGTTANDFAILNLSSATTTSGNKTGVINFAATTATNERRSASIESILTQNSATNVAADLYFSTNNNNSFTEKMRIMANGRVGIGTPSPYGQLHVAQTSNNPTSVFINYGNVNEVFFGRTQGSFAAPTIIGSGGVLGRLIGSGFDGASFINSTQIAFEVDGGSSANDMPGRIIFSTTPDGSSVLQERMRITNEGNIRITNPSIPTTNPTFATDNPYIKISATQGFAYFGNFNCDPAGIGNNGRPGHNFLGGVGALAIGMNRLGGHSGVDFWNTTSHNQAAANGIIHRGFFFRNYNTAGNEALLAYLYGDGQFYAYGFNVISDMRVKKDFTPYSPALNKLMKVNTYYYNRLNCEYDDSGNLIFNEIEPVKSDFGFKAQELNEIFPEIVKKPADETKELWAVEYGKMVVILTKAIQEQQDIINQMQEKINKMQEIILKK